MEQYASTRIRAVVQGLIGYLLLLYVVGLPLHLHVHSGLISSAESHQDDRTPPAENPCTVCDWWVHQRSAEEVAPFQCVRTALPYSYHAPAYCLPPRVATRLANSRAPPSALRLI